MELRDKWLAILNEELGGIYEVNADKINTIIDRQLAIEHPSKTMRGERCRGFYDDNYCTPDKKAEPSCPDRCMFPPRPATLADWSAE